MHDPNILPMEGGGYGKIITNEKKQFVKTQPLAHLVEVPEPYTRAISLGW
jgi:hypothetical protein